MAAITPSSDDRPRGEDGIPLIWEPGDVILDLYEVRPFSETTPFIEGGMGRVNCVWHRGWNRLLAVKSVRPNKFASAAAEESFEREAEVWVDNLGLHPNVVTCHYVRELGSLPRLFMDLVPGGSLKEWIDSGKLYEGGPDRTLKRILDVAIQFAWGLHHAHEQGLIHQDVKPANVLMTAEGVARVTDFGLAKARAEAGEQGAAPPDSSLLATWGGMTPAYCSPEQAEIAAKARAGEPRERWPKLTHSTDVWSWAVSVLEMFTGRVAWPSGSVAGHYLKRNVGDPRIPKMPPAVVELLERCFQRRPEDRLRNMQEIADALRGIYEQITGQPHPRELPEPGESLADNLNNRAVSLFDLGKKQEAAQKWQEALGVDPHHPEATYNWGLIQWRSLRMTDQKLLEKLRAVRASSADSARVDYLMGLVHLERADTQTAFQLLSKAVETGTGRAEIVAALALAKSLSDPSEQLPRTFEERTGHVNSVSWSPDGRYALSGSEDKTLRLWEVSSGKCLRTFMGHTSWVNSVSWSPDGRYALSASGDTLLEAGENTLRLWEVSSGQCLRTFMGHPSRVNSVSWSPDGRYALSGSDDKALRLWEVSSGKSLRTFEGHADCVTSVSWRPDGRYALSGSYDKTLRLWEVSSGKCLRTFEGHRGQVTSVSWSPDGRCALSGGGDGTLRLWEASSGKCLRAFEGHSYWVTSVSWSPDGRCALSAGGENPGFVRDNTLRLWEVSTGQCLRIFEGHTRQVTSVSLSPNGPYALSGSADGTLRLWGIALPKQPIPLVTSMAFAVSPARYNHLLQQVRDSLPTNPAAAAGFLQQARQQPGCARRENALELARQLSRSLAHRGFVEGWEKRIFSGHSVSWSPDGRCVLLGSDDGTLRLWEVASGNCLRTFEGHTGGVISASWSPDGRYALSGSGDNMLRLWEVSSGNCLRTFEGHTGGVISASWSPDGRYALSGSGDNMLRLWEVSSGRCLRTFEGHSDRLYSVSWSPDGRYALSRSGDETLRVWEVSSGKCLRGFKGHTGSVTSVSWSPNGRYVLSGSEDKTLRLWEVSSGQCLRTFVGHRNRVTSASWSPDGRRALSGSWDKMLRLWEVSSGKCLRTFRGHKGKVTSASWSPDGRSVLSASWDNTVRLWDMSSWKCLRIFEGHTNWVDSVSWSPDGCRALSGSLDKTLRLWELDWEFEPNQPADWDEGARPYLTNFVTVHASNPGLLSWHRRVALFIGGENRPSWTEEDFQRLLEQLGYAGYGWLRPEGIRRELETMAAAWKGSTPLADGAAT